MRDYELQLLYKSGDVADDRIAFSRLLVGKTNDKSSLPFVRNKVVEERLRADKKRVQTEV